MSLTLDHAARGWFRAFCFEHVGLCLLVRDNEPLEGVDVVIVLEKGA